MDLKVKIADIELPSPLCVASGTFGYAHEMASMVRVNNLGGIFTKTITLKPRAGNPGPRILETPSGMLNAIGLQNVGLKAYREEKLPFLKKLKAPLFVNIAGKRIEDFCRLAEALSEEKAVSGFEINLSCPNVKEGGKVFCSDPHTTLSMVQALRKATSKPIIPKLSPNVADIGPIAKACEDGGADAISLINTLVGMAVNVNTRKPMIKNITGGLSGPAIRPVALAMVYKASQSCRLPVFGIGGIATLSDVLEFLIAGASAVQIGTANFAVPDVTDRLLIELKRYMKENKLKHLGEVIGSLDVT